MQGIEDTIGISIESGFDFSHMLEVCNKRVGMLGHGQVTIMWLQKHRVWLSELVSIFVVGDGNGMATENSDDSTSNFNTKEKRKGKVWVWKFGSHFWHHFGMRWQLREEKLSWEIIGHQSSADLVPGHSLPPCSFLSHEMSWSSLLYAVCHDAMMFALCKSHSNRTSWPLNETSETEPNKPFQILLGYFALSNGDEKSGYHGEWVNKGNEESFSDFSPSRKAAWAGVLLPTVSPGKMFLLILFHWRSLEDSGS